MQASWDKIFWGGVEGAVGPLSAGVPRDKAPVPSFSSQAAMSGVDRLFIIGPWFATTKFVVADAATQARDAGVKHVVILTTCCEEMAPDDPQHPHAKRGGTMFNEKLASVL